MDKQLARVIVFAADAIQDQWEDFSPTEEGQAILDMAGERGLIHWRKPTEAELADDDWWGHGFDIGPDDAHVGELTTEFKILLASAKQHLKDEESK